MFALENNKQWKRERNGHFLVAVVIVRGNQGVFARFFFFVCFDYTSTGNQPVFFCWQNVMSEAKQLCRLGRGGEPY